MTQVLQALSSSSADIVIIDKPAADGIAKANPSAYAVQGTIFTNELYGFAVPLGDPLKLITRLNSALANAKSDGTYTAILNKYFG